MRHGTIIHDELQKALKQYLEKEHELLESNLDYRLYQKNGILHGIEVPLIKKSYNAMGHADYIQVDLKNKTGKIVDFKSIAPYPYSKKFGRKKDFHPAIHQELQIITYSLALKEKYDLKEVLCYILYFAKGESLLKKEVIVSEYYEKEVENYYRRLQSLKNKIKKKDLTSRCYKNIAVLTSIPEYTWECNLCEFRSTCISPFSSQ